MKIQAVSIDLEAFGAQFANMDSEEQGLFFKGLARELMCWKSEYNAQMQFHYVADKLKEDEKKALDNALGCLWFKP
jgi:hypothetical protein